FGVVAIRILAGIEQQPGDLEMSELTGQHECPMTIERACARQLLPRFLDQPEARCGGHIVDARATPRQRLRRWKVAEGERRHQRRRPLALASTVCRRT